MKQPFQICFSIKLADGRMSIKKKRVSSHLIYNILSLSKIAGETKSLSGKVSWTWTSSEISRTN